MSDLQTTTLPAWPLLTLPSILDRDFEVLAVAVRAHFPTAMLRVENRGGRIHGVSLLPSGDLPDMEVRRELRLFCEGATAALALRASM